ncbi:hypothetical protein GCM10009578_072520 [Streptomyces rhizosphaericus]
MAPTDAPNQYTYPLAPASASVVWIASATAKPSYPPTRRPPPPSTEALRAAALFWSSHASFHVVPLGLHSDIQVRRLVGRGWSEGVTYGWPVCTATWSAAAPSASIAAENAACSSHPAASQHTRLIPARRTVGPIALTTSTACSGVNRIEA